MSENRVSTSSLINSDSMRTQGTFIGLFEAEEGGGGAFEQKRNTCYFQSMTHHTCLELCPVEPKKNYGN